VIHSPRDRAIFRVAYHGGLRASEIGGIQMRDYDAEADRIMIHRLKGSRSGFHHLCREEARAVRAWLKIRGTRPGPMFASSHGSPISRQRLDALMKQYGSSAGIPKALRHFHVLKPSCCTHLLAQGFHADQVQDWVGHADIRNVLQPTVREMLGKPVWPPFR
jgi:type 1 fimbriae regulatory protein FimB